VPSAADPSRAHCPFLPGRARPVPHHPASPGPAHLATTPQSFGSLHSTFDNVWALDGEFIRDLHNDPSLRRRPVRQILSKMIEFGGPSFNTGAKISKDRLIPRAKSSRGSSSRRLADARQSPTDFSGEGK